ncbi:MAG: CHASE4 domain-containing protein [Candidatus Cloacimonadota bacterium]
MNIRKSTLISVNIAALVFLGVLLISTNFVIKNSFEKIEKSEIQADLDRLFETLDSELDNLVTSTSDWAVWDDSWNFVQNPNSAYIESNFTTNTFENYGLNLAVIYDLERNVVFSRYYDAENETMAIPDEELELYLKNDLGRHLANGSLVKTKGYIQSPLGALVFAAVPIVKSDGSGPHKGYLLMSKLVTGNEIASVKGFTGQRITALELAKLSNPSVEIRNKIALVRADDPVHLKGRTSVSAYGILKDVDNKDLFLIELNSRLRLTGIAKNMRNVMVLIFIGLTICQSLVLYYYISKKMIRPLVSLQDQVQSITQHPDDEILVSLVGENEIYRLARDINKMLEALHKTKAELITAKDSAEESSRIKTAFLATMNHELRTPLNHISGFSQLIGMATDLNEANSYAEQIQKSSATMLKLIEDIFDLALAEQSSLKADLNYVKAMDHFFDNKTHLEEILEASGKSEFIKLVFNPDRNAWNQSLLIDPVKVNQILSNLFRNAVKFTPEGIIEFGFELLEGGKIRYLVRDTGIGIAKEKQTLIFDFFRQADESNTRFYGGVGIGLAFSRKVTEVLGGKLYLESVEGKGTTFYLELDCKLMEIELPRASEKEDYPDYPDLTDRKILVCDNDEISKNIIIKLLKRTGAETISSTVCLDLSTKLQGMPEIDLVIIGASHMHVLKSEKIHLLKEAHPNVSFVSIQSAPSEASVEVDSENGFDCCIFQPIEKDIFYKEISRLLPKGSKA